MKRTSAVDVIIHALCPGPGEASTLGAPLVTYASRSATRVARSGAADPAGAACAKASEGSSAMEASPNGTTPIQPTNFIGFMEVSPFGGGTKPRQTWVQLA